MTNDKLGLRFTTHGGVRQGCPISPYSFITILELVVVEMGEDTEITGVTIQEEPKVNNIEPPVTKIISSHSHKERQKDNPDDRISLFADDNATLVTETKQILAAREIIGTYEEGSTAALHKGKVMILQLGAAVEKELTKSETQVKFKIMEESETENI